MTCTPGVEDDIAEGECLPGLPIRPVLGRVHGPVFIDAIKTRYERFPPAGGGCDGGRKSYGGRRAGDVDGVFEPFSRRMGPADVP